MALGLHPGIVVQRARADQHHARALFGAREQMAAASFAERTVLAGRGIVGHEIVRAGHDLEAAFLHGQDRRKRGAGEFPAIRTMAVRENQDLPRALVPHFSAIATARQHGGLLRFEESVPQPARNAKQERKSRKSRVSRRRGGTEGCGNLEARRIWFPMRRIAARKDQFMRPTPSPKRTSQETDSFV